MGQIIESLRKMQQLELRLAAVRKRETDKERRIETSLKQLQKIDEDIRRRQAEALEKQIRADHLSLEAASKEETIKKHKEALTSVRSNKEYATILTAMNTEKADGSRLETQALEMMEQVQAVRRAIGEVEQERSRMVERIEALKKELADIQAEIKPQVESLEVERDECASKIAPQTLALFHRVAAHHDGEALAAVCRLHPRREEYACSGCNMKITLDVYNSLMSRDDVLFCRNCGRIMYAEPEPPR